MKFALSISALVLAATTATAAGAQQKPPVPPVPPAARKPLVPPRPAPAPAPIMDYGDGFSYNFDYQGSLDDMKLRALEMADQARYQADQARYQTDFAMRNIDVQRLADQATEDANRAMSRIDFQKLTNISTRAAEAVDMAQQNLSSIGWGDSYSEGRFARAPRAPWAQGDPADSLYRLARQAFNDGDWRHASDLFHDVVQKFPQSAYVADCAYYEAFSRYRIGTTEELHKALSLLSDKNTPASRSSMRSDVAGLSARIRGALAARGDQQAAAQIAQDAEKNGGCDREDMSVKAEALNALGQMDPAAATPLLQQVLQRKDTCSAQLKRSALFMLVRRGDTVATNALVTVATNNAEDPNLRADAIAYLGRMPGDVPLATLENLVRTSNDDRIQRAAVRALAQNDSPRAHQGVRALIERPDASESLRSEAILSLAGDRTSTDDAAYLRSIYAKMPSERLKSAVLRALARVGGTDNVQFLLGVAGNTSESTEVRGTAIQFAARDSSVSIAEINKLYDAAESRNVREQLIYALGRRNEPAAADKLMDIVKTSTDPYARRDAVSVLSRRQDDPRVTKFLLDLVGK